MAKSSNIKGLAEIATRIESDIRSRRLGPGDRYLTAREAAEQLGLSTATCHRAMKLLVERDILIRRPNSGTFVSENMESQSTSRVRAVHILLSADRRLGELPRDAVLDGLWNALPGVGLHFTILPATNEVEYLEELLAGSASAGQLMGVIAVSCSGDIYNYLASQNLPVAVIGSVHRTEDQLASVDCDQHQAGFLLAEHMLKKGYRRFTLLIRELWRPGDHRFFEGVQESLHAAGLPIGALRVCSFPIDPRSFRQQVGPLLGEMTEPTAVICRIPIFQSLLEGVRSAEPELPWHNVEVAVHFDNNVPDNLPACSYTCRKASVAEVAEIAGKMLVQISAGEQLVERHVFLPVEFHDHKSG
jgi:DNA-binding LacI/PurR family transcriptional regulator